MLPPMPAPSALLTRAHFEARPSLPVTGPLTLTLARTHELCGAARRTLALVIAAARPGPVLWIAPDWVQTQLNGPGLCRWIDPGRLTFVHVNRASDLLWTMEEALRTGAVPCVIGEADALPDLTAVRRLHLAAEQGSTLAPRPKQGPLGLLLTSQNGGAPGVESRWSLTPAHRPGAPGWSLERLRARNAPPSQWPAAPALREGRMTVEARRV